jgi:hypothetical protein
MQEISWERTADGRAARLDGDIPQYILPILSFMRLTQEKMTAVGLISADFHGIPVSFMKRVTVYLDKRTHAEFLGLYVSDEDEQDHSEAASEQIPTLCLRHAVWTKKSDEEGFVQAASMKEYVSSQQQLQAQIVFLTPEMVPEIARLDEEAHTMVRRGVPALATSRSDAPWDSIDFSFYDILHVHISYVTHTLVSNELEAWVKRWYRSCLEVDYTGGMLPDNGCRLGYPYSMMDFWKHFPEQSFQQWRDKRRGKD